MSELFDVGVFVEDVNRACYERRGVEVQNDKVVLVKAFKNEVCMKPDPSAEVAREQAACRTGHLAFFGLLTGEAKDQGDHFSVPCYFSWDDRLSAEPEFVNKLALELLESKDKAGRRSWPRLS